MVLNEPFCHRRNKDGTIDSICTRCYLTAGTALNESALPEIERGHTCDSAWVLHWQLLSHQYAQALMFDVLFPGTNANDSTQRAHL